MNNPQQLKERIYALNPELKELTLGCECWVSGWYGKVTFITKRMNVSTFMVELNDEVMIRNITIYPSEDFTIIGHPIHLEHVLRAIAKIEGENVLQIDNYGHITYFAGSFDDMPEQYNYDLTKTFDQNIAENEELVTFLLSIIK